MSASIPESDWKLFRQLSEAALERAFQRGVAEIQRLAAEENKSAREHFWNPLEFANRYRKELADMFDDPRRSNALIQLAMIAAQKLLTVHEMARFSPDTRDFVQRWNQSAAASK